MELKKVDKRIAELSKILTKLYEDFAQQVSQQASSQEIKALRTEIHHIGNNINQIARSVNAGIATAADARYGLFLLDKVYELMYQVANP